MSVYTWRWWWWLTWCQIFKTTMDDWITYCILFQNLLPLFQTSATKQQKEPIKARICLKILKIPAWSVFVVLFWVFFVLFFSCVDRLNSKILLNDLLNFVLQLLTVKHGGIAQGRVQRRRHCRFHKLQRKCTDSLAGIAFTLFTIQLLNFLWLRLLNLHWSAIFV